MRIYLFRHVKATCEHIGDALLHGGERFRVHALVAGNRFDDPLAFFGMRVSYHNDDWFWAASASTGTLFCRTSPSGSLSSQSDSFAFQLINAPVVVLEAGMLALLVTGSLGVGAVLIRRRRLA